MNTNHLSDTPAAEVAVDVGPLAWVMDELRQTLDGVVDAVRAFVVNNEAARATDLAQVDAVDLRVARQQLHQAVGALEMVNLPAAARTLRSLEAATLRLEQKPALATPGVLPVFQKTAWALIDYLQRHMAQNPVPGLALFPVYQACQQVAGAERTHPADLWVPVAAPVPTEPGPGKVYSPSPQVRAHLDRLVLLVVKSLHPEAAASLGLLSAGLARGATDLRLRHFWMAAQAYFEAVAQRRIPDNLYARRAASRILVQYASAAQGDDPGLQALVHDLAFLVAQSETGAWDHNTDVLGLYNPADLTALQAELTGALQAWSLWAEGEQASRGPALERLAAVGDLLVALHAPSAALAQALLRVVVTLSAAATPEGAHRPPGALALELANTLLLLEAGLAGFDPQDAQVAQRHGQLADRLLDALDGRDAAAPEPWMAALYQRLSERQTLGHVVDQLKTELADVEQAFDAVFRGGAPQGLQSLPSRLAAMKGVVAMLALPAAEQALDLLAQNARDGVQASIAAPDLNPAYAPLVHTLGNLGWLLDTLRWQPERARQRFVFDPERGLLDTEAVVAAETPAPVPVPVPVSESNGTETETGGDTDAELLAIFWDEAKGVCEVGRAAVAALRQQPRALADLTALRRVFHTLKGSARMVGLSEGGEGAWAMEQLLNARLADQQLADAPFLDLCDEALAMFATWVAALQAGSGEAIDTPALRASADAMRLEGRYQPLVPVAPEPEPEVLPDAVKVVGDLQIDLELYNVFLNEADEWSRLLGTGAGEWVVQGDAPLPAALSVWAHSLAGGAGAVGYHALSQLARALEHALDRTQGRSAASLDEPLRLGVLAATDELRRLLHQFAAGFLKEPTPGLLDTLALVPGASVLVVPAEVPEPLPVVDQAQAALAPEMHGGLQDRIDVDLFPVFEEEAQELLPRLAAALRQWIARPDNSSARAELLRNLHTFKGSARLAGAARLGEMAHRMETDVLALPDAPLDGVLQPLPAVLDALESRFEALRLAHRTPDTQAVEPVVDGVWRQKPESQTWGAGPGALPPAGWAVAAAPAPVEVPGNQPSVRVRTGLLDRLLAQTGDVMVTRSRLEGDMRALRQSFKDMTGNLERLRHQLRDLELQTETQVQSRLALSRDAEPTFDPLEFDRYTRVQELTRLLAESVNDVATVQRQLQRAVDGAEDSLAAQARQTRDLQRDLLRTRMVEFDALTERLHKLVRQTAQEQNKQVRLEITGGEVEADRGVLDRLMPVLDHLLRNAVAHGVEAPASRESAGKGPEGCITLAVTQTGNDLELFLADDGAGLNWSAIRARAEALGWIDPGAPMDTDQATRFVFEPGFSTAESVDEVAGRGIGLDVARSEVLALGGRIDCQAPEGGGTGFRLVVPLSTAVTQVLMLRVGDFTFGVPAPWVSAVHRVQAGDLTQAYMTGQWTELGQPVPFFWAGALLALSAESTDAASHAARQWPVLVFHSAGQQVAWHVDEVLGPQEVVVKPLGAQLARLPGLAGATVLPSGSVGLIYNPVALAALFGSAAREWVRRQRQTGGAEAPQGLVQGATGALGGRAPLVLVVDDSITVRRVTQRLLQREGYRVALAADGVQALERLREELPAVVLCDIEMPRMDGFEFLRQLRQNPAWADLPVVMITSRIADKHRDYARSLGVDHYLGKPYAEDALLALVAGYVRLTTE